MRTPRSPVAIAVALLAVLAAGCGASSTAPGAPASTAPPGNPLAAAPAQLPAVAGKYVWLSPKSPATSSFGSFCYLSQLVGQFSGPADQVVKGQTTIIDGQPALQLKEGKQTGSAYVTISARPEFLRIGDTSGYVDFSDYNAPLALTEPPASQTVAGSKYGL